MMKVALSLPLLLLLTVQTSSGSKKNEEFRHTNIILIGATGDLAQKYLWRSLFDHFSKYYKHGKQAFSIYGCSRKSPDDGRLFMSDILLKTIKCASTDEKCRNNKKKFVEAIQYHQLKNEKHYKALADKINENIQSMYGLQGSPISPEDGRLVYLSIPPSAYAKTALHVDQYLRPAVGRPWFRVVVEKPFGHNYESAKLLTDKLNKYFTEKELYRIDHYLGKTVVKGILPFRYKNKAVYEEILNSQHVEKVEVVMKEKLDVKGRTSFYDEVGVVRDVMQNHLMEMAALVAMELPEDSGKIKEMLDSKMAVFSAVEPLSDMAVLTGQYAEYYAQCMMELPNVGETVSTPTFGAAVVSVNNARWRGVPFILMSGKKLDEKYSYVRITFKDSVHRISGTKASSKLPRQIIFHIATGQLTPAMITVSKTLPKPQPQASWKLEESEISGSLFGEKSDEVFQLVAEEETEAYTTLLDAIRLGYRHMFVDGRSLLLSWKVWNNVIKNLDKQRPRIYQGGRLDPDWLDFQVIGTRALEFVHKEEEFVVPDNQEVPGTEMRQTPGTFRDDKLVSGNTNDLIAKLAGRLKEIALAAVRDQGAFHLALPGGQSPGRLFQYLVAQPVGFPWEQTHIWQVDERCVPQDQPQSNFNLIYGNLLQHVGVPYLQIHTMAVDIGSEPCMEESDKADEMYEMKIQKLLNNDTLDFVLLGVGYDGHIASLFPNQPSLSENTKNVIYSKASPDKVSIKRMTLTYPMINRARNIAIIVLGDKKHDLVKSLSSCEADNEKYPVLGVKPELEGALVWYIDNEALFGEFL